MYSICGGRNRMPLSDCLIDAVRAAYPSPTGTYRNYEDYVI